MPRQETKYGKPPLQEVICEIHFDRSQPLKEDEIEQLRPVWKELYPVQNLAEEKKLGFKISIDGIQAREEHLGSKLICRSSDGKKLVQLAPTLMAVNHLAVYPGWREGFKPMILSRFSEAHSVLGIEGLSRLGLRYIDRIEIPETPLNWEDWFEFRIPIPDRFRRPGGKVQIHYDNELEEGLRAVCNIGTIRSEEAGSSTVMFDFDVILAGNARGDELPDRLELVHEPQALAFEAFLKDNTRELFDPIRENGICKN